MVLGLMRAARVTFAAIGRCMEGTAKEASNIKRVYEFCHNVKVDPLVVQAALVHLLVGRALRTIRSIPNVVTVAVDGHDYNNGEISGLRVSLMTGSRAIPLLWFEAIQRLIELRPPGVTWLILLDSGFRSP